MNRDAPVFVSNCGGFLKKRGKLTKCQVRKGTGSQVNGQFLQTRYFLTLTLFTGLTGSIPKITSVSYTILLFFTSGSYVSRALTYIRQIVSACKNCPLPLLGLAVLLSFCTCGYCQVLKGTRQSVLGECVGTYSGRPCVARVFIGSSSGSIALQSCSADVVFILGTWYLYLSVLRLCTHQYVLRGILGTLGQDAKILVKGQFFCKPTLFALRTFILCLRRSLTL